jgi:cAMP phosphodiesterase
LSRIAEKTNLSKLDIAVRNGSIAEGSNQALKGLKVVIIHVKENLLDDDEPPIGERILDELRKHESRANTGCEFILSYPGMSIYV